MRLTIDARARRILRRLPVITVYSAAELALMAGLAVQCARLIWVAVAALITAFGEDLVRSLGGQVPTIPAIPLSAAFIYLAFFAGGFFLYASIYAALGSFATSGQDAQNMQFLYKGTRPAPPAPITRTREAQRVA